MKEKITDYLIYLVVIAANIGLSFLLNFIFNQNDLTNFIMFGFGVTIVSLLVIYLICQKLGYEVDIFAYNIEQTKHMILNNMFIGNLFSIPITLVISVLL